MRWARINASWGALSQEAKVAAAKAGLRPPERNPFLNNVAQAVEVLDAMGRCADLCRKLAEPDGPFEGDSVPVPFEVRAGVGTASQRRREARCSISSSSTTRPCGARHHHDPHGAELREPGGGHARGAEKLIADGAEAPEVRAEVEKLVRAYDPCFSCSVH